MSNFHFLLHYPNQLYQFAFVCLYCSIYLLTIASFYEESLSLEIALSVLKFYFDTHWKKLENSTWLLLTFSIHFHVSQLKALRLKTHHFNTKLSCQKSMLRQIARGIQNGSVIKNRVLPATTLLPKCPYSYFSWALKVFWGCFF